VTPAPPAPAPDAALPEEPAERAAAPAPPPELVRVHVNATPWAEIRVDGREVGLTPLADLELSPGPHRFEARMPDGRVIERQVEIGRQNPYVVFP
jgi:hypothetical protein